MFSSFHEYIQLAKIFYFHLLCSSLSGNEVKLLSKSFLSFYGKKERKEGDISWPESDLDLSRKYLI